MTKGGYMLIPRILSKIARLCCEESFRFALGCVRISRDSRGPVAVVTDAKRLIVCRWPELDGNKREPFATLIPKRQWRTAMHISSRQSDMLKIEDPIEENFVTFCSEDGSQDIRVTIKTDGGIYPKWEHLISLPPADKSVKINISGTLLRELLEAMPLDEEISSKVVMYVPHDHSKSIILTASGPHGIETTAAIMPMTDDNEQSNISDKKAGAFWGRLAKKVFGNDTEKWKR